MKVFISGATGFIGQPLTREMIQQGWEVFALVRNPDSSQAQVLTKLGVHCLQGDITSKTTFHAYLQNIDVVVHNAGQYEYGLDEKAKMKMQAINCTGTTNILASAKENQINRVLYVSTVQAFGDSGKEIQDEHFVRKSIPRTVYEKTKTEAHQIANDFRKQGLPLMIVNPNGVIGPNDHSAFGYFLRLYLNKLKPPIGWSAGSIFSLVYLQDLVQGILLAIKNGQPGEDYFLCGESKTFREHASCWHKFPGAAKNDLWLSDTLAAILFYPFEAIQRKMGLPAFISRETVWGGDTNFNYSSEKAKKELGWTHCSAEEMWTKTIEAEIILMEKRKNTNLIVRLNPLPTIH